MVALASTSPSDFPDGFGPPLSDFESDGPEESLGSQWSPTFSCVCFTAPQAVRATRDSLVYSSSAES